MNDNIKEKQVEFEKIMNEMGIKNIKDIPNNVQIKKEHIEVWVIS